MENKYYNVSENCYREVYKVGVDHYGHSSDDVILNLTLSDWVNQNNLKNKKIIEFACGEGSCGAILSELGCIYHGVDISITAIEKAKTALKNYKNATVSLLDMVTQTVDNIYDAALDVIGLPMLVTDSDRINYLKNVYSSIKPGAPILFFREPYLENTFKYVVNSIEEWKDITGNDFNSFVTRYFIRNNKPIKVNVPLIPTRANNKLGYINEMIEAGFILDHFTKAKINNQCLNSIAIYAHKL